MTIPSHDGVAHHHKPSASHAKHTYHPRRLPITLYPVTIRLHAAHAHNVVVLGNFNDGKPQPMQQMGEGYWHVTLELKRGRYEYRFLVDNVPLLDPKSRGVITAADGLKYSLLEVGF